MSSQSFMRGVVDALMPEGPILTPADGGDLGNFLAGFADNDQEVLDDLADLAYIRDPYNCPAAYLPDLEREFGIAPSDSYTTDERRIKLAIVRYKKKHLPTAEFIQSVLDKAGYGTDGYGLKVTVNASPAADPAPIVDDAYQLVAHTPGDGAGACAGHSTSYAAKRGGYYLINGDVYITVPIYIQAGLVQCRAFDGSDSVARCAGYYQTYTLFINQYFSPPSGYWPLIFFIGGAVSRNVDGSIASVSTVWIPSRKRQDLHRLLLRFKPLGIWAAMIVQYS